MASHEPDPRLAVPAPGPGKARIRPACQSAGMWGDIGVGTLLLDFLDAAADLAFAGIGTFDTHLRAYAERPEALRHELDARSLRLVAVDALLDEEDDAYFFRLADFLGVVGCSSLVVIGGQGTTADDYQRVAARLNYIGAGTLRRGVTTLYHHHEGTIAATEEEVEQLLRFLDTRSVALLADTGHIAQDMAVTPEAFIRRHVARLRLIELKDFAPERGLGYELGRGSVDFPAVAQAR